MPGTIVSGLRLLLRVAVLLSAISAGFAALVLLAGLVSPDFSAGLVDGALGDPALQLRPATELALWRAILVSLLLGGLLAAAGLVFQLGRLLDTIIARDPFQKRNVVRLQAIAGALAIIELSRMATPLIMREVLSEPPRVQAELNLAAWLGVAVVLILAEVFREGARLRAETEGLV